MVKRVLFICCVLLNFSALAAQQLTASVDKNPAMLGESVTLEVTADFKANADALNFRVLERDFTVMVPSVSQSTRVINGDASQSTSWKVVMLPKTTGMFTIPAFELNGLKTEPIQLQIVERSQQALSGNTDELFLQSELEQQELYVQQLSYYTVTIYFSGDLQRGSLTEPVLEEATIEQVGQDKEGSELVNGMRYRTISRRYAITPQRSGNFTITPPTFTGEIIDRDSARYNYFARTKTVVQQAQPIDLQVKAAPDTFPGSWLVAGLVTLTEEWSPPQRQLVQGEPVTRTITLSAVDVAGNQLPDLPQNFPDGLRLYHESPQVKSAERNGRLVAQKIFTTAVVATAEGELQLPEVTLPWWNSKTNTLAYATLPARTLTVKPGDNTNTAVVANEPRPVNQPLKSDAMPAWGWTHTTTLFATLWGLTLIACYLIWQHRSTTNVPVTSDNRVKFNTAKLQQACEQNNAKMAKAELLRWAHQQLDVRCHSLTELADMLHSDTFKTELHKLNEALYGCPQQPWQGQLLWQQFTQYKITTRGADSNTQLSSLYPN